MAVEPDEALHRQLAHVAAQYTSVNQICWTIFSIFAAANALLANGLVQSGAFDGLLSLRIRGLVLSIVGLSVALAWLLLLGRSLRHLLFYEALIRKLEDDLSVDQRHAMFSERSDLRKQYLVGVNTVFSAKRVMMTCTALTLVGWFLALIYFCRNDL